LRLAAGTGVISGTPTATGASTFTVTATDSGSPAQSKSLSLTITVTGPTLTITSSTLAAATVGTAYTQTMAATGGTPTYTWSISSGSLPAGFTLTSAGVISGAPTAAGTYRISVTVTDSASPAQTQSVATSIIVAALVVAGPGTTWFVRPDAMPRTGTRLIPGAGTAKGTTSASIHLYPRGPRRNPPGSSAAARMELTAARRSTTTNPYGSTNEMQLNLLSTSNVMIEGIELTTHNGVCTLGMGTPSYPRGCSSSVPYDDYAQNGFLFNTTSASITLQDVYIHGFNASGLDGHIGGQITMTRVFSGFNAFAGWNFDDGSGTQDATGSGINASYVTMIFNGCYEQYPITATYPAQVCYDTNSAEFGDSWSGQGVGTESVMSSFICDHCVDDYNTKDGFIGPHIAIPTLTITNSVAIGNMGANWKWGGEVGVVNTTTFENNLTVNNCSRMSEPMAGVFSTYNKYLTGFCRAGGNGIASIIPIGSTWNMRNNTFITAQQIAWSVACAYPDLICPATINSTNNVFLGYVDPNNPYGGTNVPTTHYLGAGIIVNASHNVEFGMRDGSCPSTANGMICADPQMPIEPAQAWTGEAALNVFNPFTAGNSFHPTSTSPLLRAGLEKPGLTTDYYGVTRPRPPSI
jgi:hypothetical protein